MSDIETDMLFLGKIPERLEIKIPIPRKKENPLSWRSLARFAMEAK